MRKRIILTLLASTAIAGCEQASQPAPSDSTEPASEAASELESQVIMNLPMTTESAAARDLFLAGLHAGDVGRFTEANLLFEQAVEADPNFAYAYMQAGLTGASTEEFATNLAAAREHMDGASEAEIHIIQGWQAAFDGDAEGQLAHTAAVTELHDDSPRAWLNHAGALTGLNRIAGARTAIAKAIALEPEFAAAHMQAGNNYMNQIPKDFDKAATHFEKAVSLEPNESTPYDLLGDVHRAQGKLEEARDDYTKAAELAPELGSPIQQRGHVNSFLGDYDAARADYTRSIELEEARGTNIGPFYAVFRAYVSLHEDKPDDAIAELRQLVADVQGSGMDGENDLIINALTNVVQIATHHRDYDTAEAAIDDLAVAIRARAADTGNPDFTRTQEGVIVTQRGLLAARRGDAEGAAARAAEFAAIVEPDSNPRKLEPMHFVQGMSAVEAGDCEAAEAHLAQANQANIYVRYNRGLCFEQTGQTDAAQDIYRELAVYNFNGPYYAMIRRDVLQRVAG